MTCVATGGAIGALVRLDRPVYGFTCGAISVAMIGGAKTLFGRVGFYVTLGLVAADLLNKVGKILREAHDRQRTIDLVRQRVLQDYRNEVLARTPVEKA